MKDVSALIDEVLALPDLMPSTQEDLEDFKRELAEGGLGKDDREYIAALHQRLTSGGVPSTVAADDDEDDEDDDENDGAITALEAEIEELKEALAERDARIGELEAQLEAGQSTSGES